MRTKYLVTAGVVTLGLAVALTASAALTSVLSPSSVGNYNQLTAVGSATRYQNVDEAVCNGTTDYNHTSTVGNRDSYGISLASVPDGALITQIEIVPCASRNTGGGGSATLSVGYRFNDVDTTAGNYALPTGTTPVDRATTSVATALTKTSTSTLEIGAQYSAGTRGIRVSRMVARLTYTTLPAAPTNLTATSLTIGTTTQVTLNWTDNSSDETGFKVERSIGTSTFIQIGTTGTNTTTYIDSPVSVGTLYNYRVRAYNTAGDSAYSSTTSITP